MAKIKNNVEIKFDVRIDERGFIDRYGKEYLDNKIDFNSTIKELNLPHGTYTILIKINNAD